MKVKIYNSQTKEELQFDLASATRSSGKCTVGRSPTSGLMLESSHVSRNHSVFIYQEGSYYFADTSSSNGSLINDNVTLKNRLYLLKAGDVIQIGKFVLTPQPVVKDYDELLTVATPSKKVPVAVDAEPAVVSAMPEEVVERAEEISAAVEEPVNARKLEQKVPEDNSCVQTSQVNQQIKRVSPMTLSQKFYQSHELEIAEEFEQALEANSLEKTKDLLDKILELGEGK